MFTAVQIRIDADLQAFVRKVKKETYSRSNSHAANLIFRHGKIHWKRDQVIPKKLHNGHD